MDLYKIIGAIINCEDCVGLPSARKFFCKSATSLITVKDCDKDVWNDGLY